MPTSLHRIALTTLVSARIAKKLKRDLQNDWWASVGGAYIHRMDSPIPTRRLRLRPVEAGDAELLWARRNHPDVARYQDWETPFPRQRANQIVESVMAMDGPAPDEWWMLTVTNPEDDVVMGDVVLHLTWEGRCAEVGYTFAPEFWGNGFAIESVEALIAWAFERLPLTRVFGMLHPDNDASARVLERAGMLFEGHTRLSFWVGDDNSDDHIYGITRPMWETWINRDRTPPDRVALVELDEHNHRDAWRLQTHKTQEKFVSPMPGSFADALFPFDDGRRLVPWMRGVMADDEMVAFVMLSEPDPDPYLWRLLVDRLHQRRGIGRRVVDLVVEQCRTWGADSLVTSWVEGRGSPASFYLGYGFESTGRIVDGETEARLRV